MPPKKIEQKPKAPFWDRVKNSAFFGPLAVSAYVAIGVSCLGHFWGKMSAETYEYYRVVWLQSLLPRLYIEPSTEELIQMYQTAISAQQQR